MKKLFPNIDTLHMALHKLSFLMAMLVVLSSCSNEDDMEQADKQLAFTFGTVDETRVSRASYEEYLGEEFGVYAKLFRPEYDPSTATGQEFMVNEKVTYDGAVCNTQNTYYWVKGDTHFAAYSPFTADIDAADLSVTLPERPYAGYSYNGAVDGRTDYMFSNEQIGGYEDFPNGCVPIIFHHALTKLDFSVRLSKVAEGTTTWSMDVVSLKLSNLRNRGSVTFTHGGETEYDKIVNGGHVNNWKSNADELWDTKEFSAGAAYDNLYLGDIAVNNASISIDDTWEHTIDDVLYLMPQQLYGNGDSEFVQSLTIEYRLHTTKGGVTKSTDNIVTVPLRTASITKWSINQYVKYKILLEPGGAASLDVNVQPWTVEEFTNEFSYTVTVNQYDKIKWIAGTYAEIDDDKVVLLDDIDTAAEFTFNIAGPLGGTWQAFFVTKSGSNTAFTLSQKEGPVGTPCTIKVKATARNESSSANMAELRFAVIKPGHILPVDALTNLSDGRNYTIVQNINK